MWTTLHGSAPACNSVEALLLQVTGLAVSDRMPYLFSCSLDKQVKCWDLETNKVSGRHPS